MNILIKVGHFFLEKHTLYIHIYMTQLHNKTTVTVLYQIIDPFFYCIGKKNANTIVIITI